MRSILDKSFRYTPSVSTDLKKTFARIKRQRAEEAAATAQPKAPAIPIKRGAK